MSRQSQKRGVDEAVTDIGVDVGAEKSTPQSTTIQARTESTRESTREKLDRQARERPGRIGRVMHRERTKTQHDHARCVVCRRVPQRVVEIDVRTVAARSLLSRNHVYRVVDPDVGSRRGLRTLETMRRIAHDGLGISLDELARLILD